MLLPSKQIGKPSSPEDRIFIPPNFAHREVGDDQLDEPADESGNKSRLHHLPAGSLDGWPFRRPRCPNEFSDRDIGRVARALATVEKDVNDVICAMVAGDAGRMNPPPPTSSMAPGGDADGDRDDDQRGIIPIADNEFAVVRPVFDDLVQRLAYQGTEEAGVLFGPAETQLGTYWLQDTLGKKTKSSFTLHTPSLNEEIQRMKSFNHELLAVIHAHPDGVWRPSTGDIRYVRDLFEMNDDVTHFFMPLVVSKQFIPYLLFRDDPDRVVEAPLKIVG